MPSGKRETERKGNAPVNTGPSPDCDGRTNNLVEEADEHAYIGFHCFLLCCYTFVNERRSCCG
ncbi:hypothetical protein T07_13221 [Trichinella nelsoni]|uniref:Uncharacterized protein n=1 Tax=Trichinella nelsoni TaxID=6336 RepID=A0A0V0RVN1_9BILA|nr:hypothetical protein T07_13221 [Trichinella nelsoni]